MFAILNQSGSSALTVRKRALTAISVILLHLAVGYLLLGAFGIDAARTVRSVLKVSNIQAEKLPDPPATKAIAVEQKPTGEASEKNLKSKAAPREAPKAKVKIKPAKPQTVATKAGPGTDSSSGSTNVAGPGAGAGGQGNGNGAGGRGDGDGSQVATRAEYVSGRITNKDYPKTAAKAKIGGTVVAYYTVLASGRVAGCQIKQSSGNSELDATTCSLIEERFRYRPARNSGGEPIDTKTGWQQVWWLESNRGSKVTE
jgi:periplasmic protein TonB